MTPSEERSNMGNEEEDFKKALEAFEEVVKHEREVRYTPEAELVKALEKTFSRAMKLVEAYGGALTSVEVSRLQAVSQVPAFVAGAPEEGWKLVAQEERKQVEILERLLETLEAGHRTTVILAAMGWAIAIIVPLLIWWLGR